MTEPTGAPYTEADLRDLQVARDIANESIAAWVDPAVRLLSPRDADGWECKRIADVAHLLAAALV